MICRHIQGVSRIDRVATDTKRVISGFSSVEKAIRSEAKTKRRVGKKQIRTTIII